MSPAEVITDAAPVYPRLLDELVPTAWHHVEQYADNPIEADHSQLKRRIRPMRGLKTDRSAQVVSDLSSRPGSGRSLLTNLATQQRPQHDGRADGEPLIAAAQCVELLAGEASGSAVVPAGGLVEVAVRGEGEAGGEKVDHGVSTHDVG